MKMTSDKHEDHNHVQDPRCGSVCQAKPDAQQETTDSGTGLLATIVQSRSTNSRAYNVAIRNDGGATAEFGGESLALHIEPPPSRVFPTGTVDATTLRRLLIAIGDVSKIPTAGRMKSASFGTRTQIEYANKTSGDLQSVPQQISDGDSALVRASQELSRIVQATLIQLKIDSRVITPVGIPGSLIRSSAGN
ncbi:MAG: hypothetical protein ABSE96_23640 [Terracidiphilus sp.]